jgi:hypothetical protein
MVRKIHIKNIWKSFAALALLGVYFTFLTFQNIGVLIEHEDHVHEICTPELELDSCHRHVFHNDKIEGCDHKDHIHPPKDQKKVLTAVVSPHDLPEFVFPEMFVSKPETSSIFVEHQLILDRFYLSSYFRGPPAQV